MAPVPLRSDSVPRGMVGKQIVRNRLLTVTLVTAALLNAALVALIAAALAQSFVAVAVVMALIAAFVLFTWLQASSGTRPLGCRPPQSPAEQRLLARMQDLAQRLGVEPPRLFISGEQAPNAWASGHGPKAIVVVTASLMASLDEDELEGVVAHELAHIANRDTRLAILSMALLNWARAVTVVVTATAVVAWLWGKAWLGYTGRDTIETLVVKGLGMFMAVAAGLAFLAGQFWFLVCALMRLGLGRQREWMADAIGAQLTGNPAAMANALAKMEDLPTKLSRGAWLTQELCIIGEPSRGFLADLMETHPPTSRRIAQLRAFADGRKPPERGLAGPALAAAAMVLVLFGVGILAATWRPAPATTSPGGTPIFNQQNTSLQSPAPPLGGMTTPTGPAPLPAPVTSPSTKPSSPPPPPPPPQPVTVFINPVQWLGSSSWNQLGPTYEGDPDIAGLGATHTHAFGNDYGSFDYEFYLDSFTGNTATVTARLSSNYPWYTAPADGFSDVSLIVNGYWYPSKQVMPDNGSGTNYTWQIEPQLLFGGRNTLSLVVEAGAAYRHGICIYHQAVVAGQSDSSIRVRIQP